MSDDNEETEKKVFNIFQGGRTEQPEDEKQIPELEYVIVDQDNNRFDIKGFVVFTPQHLALMRDDGKGPIPILVMPLTNVKFAGLAKDLDLTDDD